MGNPGPEPYPEVINAKWYEIWADNFWDGFDPVGFCDHPFDSVSHCCVSGIELNNWLAVSYGCRDMTEICLASGWNAQRITRIVGPYDNQQDCVDQL